MLRKRRRQRGGPTLIHNYGIAQKEARKYDIGLHCGEGRASAGKSASGLEARNQRIDDRRYCNYREA
jgi:hypothetical protein